DPIAGTLEFIVHHEVGHRQTCPGSPEMGDQLHEAVWQVLEPQHRVGLTGYTVNLLADILTNLALVEAGHAALDGIVIDWYDQAEAANASLWQRLSTFLRQRPRPYEPYFAIFVGTQLAIAGDGAARDLLEPYLGGDGVAEAITKLTGLLGDAAVRRNRAAWPELFRQGAEILAPFLPLSPPARVTSAAHPWLNPNSPDEARRRGSDTWFDPESDRPCGWRRRAGLQPSEALRTATLDSFYRQEARKLLALQAHVSHSPQRSRQAWLCNLAPTPLLEQALAGWGKLDHIALAIDISTSMTVAQGKEKVRPPYVPWSLSCRYHQALLALYRLVKWIEGQPDILGLDVLSFFEDTQSSGWFAAGDFAERALRTILTQRRGRTTHLDPEELKRQVLACPGEGVLLFILSDGEIPTGDALLAVLRELRARCLPVLLLAGKETALSHKMRAAAMPVHTQVELATLDTLIIEDIERGLGGTASLGTGGQLGSLELSGKAARQGVAPPRSSPAVAAPRREPASGDKVHFAATGPTAVAPGTSCIVAVWAHLEAQRQAMLERAMQAYDHRAIGTKGAVTVTRGTSLTMRLALPSLIVEDPEETVEWNGEIIDATFQVSVPADAKHGLRTGQVTVYAAGLRIARLHITLHVGPAGMKPRGLSEREERVRTAFASYADEDYDEVMARIQGMKKVRPDLDVFIDKTSLRSGDRWQERIVHEIERRDILYLFWSKPASISEWVKLEWSTALERRGLEHISPVPLVSPKVAPPPKELEALHFGDPELLHY
ncbi:MAG TPA: toll/interleukin-1 receptor domain-containing protein, partial [Anaerolineae bacterium]|nr:toll/interleukin-1 receptor domain-containing protein [Anaerolineae bacterium]